MLKHLPLLTLIALVAAQDVCTADHTPDSLLKCMDTSFKAIGACADTNASCLCTQLTKYAACFDACPNDPDSQRAKKSTLDEAAGYCNNTMAGKQSPLVELSHVTQNNTLLSGNSTMMTNNATSIITTQVTDAPKISSSGRTTVGWILGLAAMVYL
jgi:hypothetical protein